MATLLFQDTFAEDANLVDHLPSTGTPWAYDDTDDAYTCHASGFLDGTIAAFTAPARNTYLLPVGIKRWRIQADVTRGGVDFVGGGFTFHGLCNPDPIASWTLFNTLAMGVARRDAGSVQFSVVYVRPALPAGPATVNLVSAQVLHAGGTSRRYILEVDELAGNVSLFLADAGTGANEIPIAAGSVDPPTGDGLFTAELTAHVADDTDERLIGLQGGWSASGQVYFAAADLRIYELEVPTTGAPCTQRLTVFDDDRVTPLWEVSTDPTHPFPFLEEASDYAEQRLDIAKGAATLTTMRAIIIDKAIIPGDQDGGFMANKLYRLGIPDVGGHRARYIRFDPDGAPIVVVDGPAGQPVMDGYAAFSFEIRDWREIEREMPLFDTIFPTAELSEDEADTTPTSGGTDSSINWNTDNH